jgi:hypothetical protein
MSEDLESLGERIAEQAAHLDAALHRLLTDLRMFDRGGGWHAQGARSCAHWLSWRVGWGLGAAREHLRVADRLADLPLLDDALRREIFRPVVQSATLPRAMARPIAVTARYRQLRSPTIAEALEQVRLAWLSERDGCRLRCMLLELLAELKD